MENFLLSVSASYAAQKPVIVIQLLLLATQLVHYNISDAVVALAVSPVVDTIHISHCLTFPTCCSRAETQVLLS